MFFYDNKKHTVFLVLFFIFFVFIIGYSTGAIKNKHKSQVDLLNDTLDTDNANIKGAIVDDISKSFIRNNDFSKGNLKIRKTQLAFELLYNKCGHILLLKNVLVPIEKYNSINEVANDYPTWVVKQFSENKIILIKTRDTYCPRHYILKDVNGVLAIYKSVKESQSPLLIKKTNINIDILSKQLQDEIRHGKIVDSLEEIEVIIENYDS